MSESTVEQVQNADYTLKSVDLDALYVMAQSQGFGILGVLFRSLNELESFNLNERIKARIERASQAYRHIAQKRAAPYDAEQDCTLTPFVAGCALGYIVVRQKFLKGLTCLQADAYNELEHVPDGLMVASSRVIDSKEFSLHLVAAMERGEELLWDQTFPLCDISYELFEMPGSVDGFFNGFAYMYACAAEAESWVAYMESTADRIESHLTIDKS